MSSYWILCFAGRFLGYQQKPNCRSIFFCEFCGKFSFSLIWSAVLQENKILWEIGFSKSKQIKTEPDMLDLPFRISDRTCATIRFDWRGCPEQSDCNTLLIAFATMLCPRIAGFVRCFVSPRLPVPPPQLHWVSTMDVSTIHSFWISSPTFIAIVAFEWFGLMSPNSIDNIDELKSSNQTFTVDWDCSMSFGRSKCCGDFHFEDLDTRDSDSWPNFQFRTAS